MISENKLTLILMQLPFHGLKNLKMSNWVRDQTKSSDAEQMENRNQESRGGGSRMASSEVSYTIL